MHLQKSGDAELSHSGLAGSLAYVQVVAVYKVPIISTDALMRRQRANPGEPAIRMMRRRCGMATCKQ